MSTITLEQRNLLLAQLESLKEVKTKIIVERDKLEGEIAKVSKLIDALKAATDE